MGLSEHQPSGAGLPDDGWLVILADDSGRTVATATFASEGAARDFAARRPGAPEGANATLIERRAGRAARSEHIDSASAHAPPRR